MSAHVTFGPRLRCERERRGISLSALSTRTKVGADLWIGLESNDFSKWPSGIFARAFIRDYARAVGLDEEDLVDDFCRLFPKVGDRRAARIIKAHAELIGHDPSALDEAALLPPEGERRASGRERRAEVRARRIRFAPRTVSAAIDIGCTLSLAASLSAFAGVGFWAAAGVSGLLYFSLATIFSGASRAAMPWPSSAPRIPALFAVRDHRAHA